MSSTEPAVLRAYERGLLATIRQNVFRYRLRPEPSDVVALGSALSFASVGLGLGTAVLVGVVLDSWLIWPAGAFAATIVYVLASGVEISLAERARRG